MSNFNYFPTTWVDDETVGTAEILNNIEDGVLNAHEGLNELEYNKVTKNTKSMNFIAISDIHAGYDTVGYPSKSLESPDRLLNMVNFLNTFIDNNVVDFVLVLGDLTSDNAGSNEYNYLKDITKYFAKIKRPVYVLPGNHDAYSNNEFKNIFGYDRQYTIQYDDTIFIMLDNFRDLSNITESGSVYTGIDMVFLQEQINKFKDKNIVLCSHYFDINNESDLSTLISNNDNIITLIQGHSHKANISDFNTKKIINIGNFSYPMDMLNITEQDLWGFSYIYTKNNGLHYKHCIPPFKYTNAFDYSDTWRYINSTVIDSNFTKYDDTKNANIIINSNSIHSRPLKYEEKINRNTNTLNDYIIISANTDLNNLGVGCYMSCTQAISSTLLNIPLDEIDGGFKLIVEKIRHHKNDFGGLKQTIINNNDMYVRYCVTPKSYTEWRKNRLAFNYETLYTTTATNIGVGSTITVDLKKYRKLDIYVSGGANVMSCTNNEGYVRGGCMTCTADSAQNYYFTGTYTNGILTITSCILVMINLNTFAITKQAININKIVGIV